MSEINNTQVVNAADGSSFSLPGAWTPATVTSNYTQLAGMRSSVDEADGVRTITFSPVTGAKG